MVAAAGNLGDSRKVWPAADDWTISVGARWDRKTRRRHPSAVSVDWVDLCARKALTSPARSRPSLFKIRPTHDKVEQFKGEAVWSGTSFSAPHVSGKVAEILQTNLNLDRGGVLAKLRDLGGGRRVQDLGWYVP